MTVKDFINVSDLQNRLSRSILNIAKPEEPEPVREEMTRNIPKVVVSKLDDGDLIDLETEITETEIEPVDTVFDVDIDDRQEEEEWENEDEKLELERETCGFFKKLKNPKELWRDLKFLPVELDIIKLLEDPEPPDKFSKIDIQSRRSFPLAFCISLIIYLFAFSYYLTDDFPERNTDVSLYRN